MYFANSTEGDALVAQCEKCPLGREGVSCPVLMVQALYNYDQVGNEKLKSAMNTLINDKGECQMRKEVLKVVKLEPEKHWLERFDEENH